MQEPDVEGHVLEPALRKDVIGMVMAVDEAGDQQLALGIDETGVGRFPLSRFGDPNFAVPNLAGWGHRGDAVALNDDVPRRRLMDVKVAIKYAGAADQCHRIGGAERSPCHRFKACRSVRLDRDSPFGFARQE
jgi:hypothetical protein